MTRERENSFPHIDFYVEGTNLFNTNYYDLANIPMPGRWVKCGRLTSGLNKRRMALMPELPAIV